MTHGRHAARPARAPTPPSRPPRSAPARAAAVTWSTHNPSACRVPPRPRRPRPRAMLTVQGACALRSPVNTARMATAIAKIVTGARSVAEREARRDTRRQHGRVVAEPRWQPGRDTRRQHGWTALGRRLRYGPTGARRDELPAGAPRPIAVAVA